MKKRIVRTKKMTENPQWTAKDFKRARPAREALPEIFGKKVAEELLRPRGRPKSPDSKVAISLRIAPTVLEMWKASGAGWQTRMAESLKRHAPVPSRR